MPGEDAEGVGIDHESRLFQAIEEDAVRGFRANPLDSQQFRTQKIPTGPRPLQPWIAAIAVEQEIQESFLTAWL